jgi:hypothetical protein
MTRSLLLFLLTAVLVAGCGPKGQSLPLYATKQVVQTTSGAAGWEKSYLHLAKNAQSGKGVKVALLDTAFQKEQEWGSHLQKEENFLPTSAEQPSKRGLHADLMMHVLLSVSSDVEVYHGIVASSDGKVQKEALSKGLKWAIAQGVDIVNMSISFPHAEPELEEILQEACEKGILLVSAAGNEGANGVSYPASSPYVLAVGGATERGERWEFSNYGPEMDFCMPSVHIQAEPGESQGGLHEGTSYSAVILTGIAARLKEKTPDADPRFLEDSLKNMTNQSRKDNSCGYGVPVF